ncbi:Sugar transferase involved in LPS biosynthesis (colanic, teichoic acid) [Ruminococcaceae bacterium YRB3002]|nr:Sugar transferase involved in LPS biosynthesis (colanic, teichoic acid) [Ruminococcaceae bacterium YRB3002]
MIYSVVKRFSDVFLSLFALIVLSPVLLIAVVGIYISSPGPVLFKANRIGKGGKQFTMYKFRSMHLNNEKGHMITLRTDNRIFPFGRFLRKSKVDELPQLVNILQGKMSIVGWRPEDEENVKKVFVGKYKEILNIKPGLTSPGSLYDYTHGEKYEDEELYEKEFLPRKMDLELYYVRHRSLGYDARLIGRTIKTIIRIVWGKEDFAEPTELHEV